MRRQMGHSPKRRVAGLTLNLAEEYNFPEVRVKHGGNGNAGDDDR
jgi:hypothetical protein